MGLHHVIHETALACGAMSRIAIQLFMAMFPPLEHPEGGGSEVMPSVNLPSEGGHRKHPSFLGQWLCKVHSCFLSPHQSFATLCDSLSKRSFYSSFSLHVQVFPLLKLLFLLCWRIMASPPIPPSWVWMRDMEICPQSHVFATPVLQRKCVCCLLEQKKVEVSECGETYFNL